ncbi:MAG: hypothetical protein WKF42_08550, partial [Solirubrobacteraceae bacterium]
MDPDISAPDASSERYKRGVQALAQLDPDIGRELTEALEDIAPDLARLTIEIGFGDIYSRPGLDSAHA